MSGRAGWRAMSANPARSWVDFFVLPRASPGRIGARALVRRWAGKDDRLCQRRLIGFAPGAARTACGIERCVGVEPVREVVVLVEAWCRSEGSMAWDAAPGLDWAAIASTW